MHILYFYFILDLKLVDMSIFYEEEHKTCYNYTVPEESVFKYFELEKDSPPVFSEMNRSMLCFVGKGTIVIKFGRHNTVEIGERRFFFVPPCVNFYGWQLTSAQLLTCAFTGIPKFCNIYTFDNLTHEMQESVSKENRLFTLPICDRLHEFFCLLTECMQDGILCMHYHQLKLQELFLLLRAYYSKEDLVKMFMPVLGVDNEFRSFVLQHYRKFADIKQFSELANMSPSTFQRKFKQTFRKPFNEWLLERKSELIIRELKTSTKAINEIADEFGFSSVQYFSNFCKRQFGKNPTELRFDPF